MKELSGLHVQAKVGISDDTQIKFEPFFFFWLIN